MPSETEKPKTANLGALLKGLKEAGIDFILVGGVAAVAQGAPITTVDLDIVHRRDEDNIKKLSAFLRSINAYQRRPDNNVIKPDDRDLAGEGHLLLSTDFGPLDALGIIENNSGYEELLPHAVELEFQGYPLMVLSLDAMIKLKKTADTPQEEYRLKILEETLKLINGE